jgi:hypothetical protein
MAKQMGTVFFSGTIDNLTFYYMNGKPYVRQKSCLTGKRVKKDPQFENTMRNANWHGRGTQLAAPVHNSLPKEMRLQGLMGKMGAWAAKLIRKGLSEADIIVQLKEHWLPKPKKETQQPDVRKGALSLTRREPVLTTTSLPIQPYAQPKFDTPLPVREAALPPVLQHYPVAALCFAPAIKTVVDACESG